MTYINAFLAPVLDIVLEMSPYLLLGFLMAGFLHVFIPRGWFARYLSGNTLRSVFNAAVLGIPLPLCSCGVIPTAMSLRREGASKAAVVSFLIATPQTGVDSIFATFSLMGLPFAIIRPIVALATAIFGGSLVNFCESSIVDSPVGEMVSTHKQNNETKLPFFVRLKEALRFAFVEMMEDIGKWLVVGLIIAGLITALVPDTWFAAFRDNSLMSMLLVLVISVPMYVCATGSIPIAVALMMKGLTPGAALVLLMAGPAVNVASMLVINKVLGRKTLYVYLWSIILGSLAFGFAIDTLLPYEWFKSSAGMCACCHSTPSLFSWLCTFLLIILLLNVLCKRLMGKETCSCGCGHDEGSSCESHHFGAQHNTCHEGCCSCTSESTCQRETHVFAVGGMHCNHCRSNVEQALQSLEGVESVSVDLHAAKAEVCGSHLDDNVLIQAVTSIGFTAERIG